MRLDDDAAISITAPWNGWRSAQVRLGALREPHWYQPAGAPKPLLHVYVSCTSISSGELTHVCDPASAPHRFRACILKSHNMPAVYAELASRAGGDQTTTGRGWSASAASRQEPSTARTRSR
jgi:hypothetical protein